MPSMIWVDCLAPAQDVVADGTRNDEAPMKTVVKHVISFLNEDRRSERHRPHLLNMEAVQISQVHLNRR